MNKKGEKAKMLKVADMDYKNIKHLLYILPICSKCYAKTGRDKEEA